MLSGTVDVWARLWPEGGPKEVDDDDRLLEEIASFPARGGDPRWRTSARGQAAVVASAIGATSGSCVRGRCRLGMVSERERDDSKLEHTR